jgi:hypothetical protein
LRWKAFGREFLSMDLMFDALYLLSKPDSAYKLRVPLSALIDYKGFRAIAIGAIPIQPSLAVLLRDEKLKAELSDVGEVLNLKENTFE